jgi:hypothetical protein
LRSTSGPQPYLLLTADSQPLQLLREGHDHVARCFHRSGLPCRLASGSLTKVKSCSGAKCRRFSPCSARQCPRVWPRCAVKCPLCACHRGPPHHPHRPRVCGRLYKRCQMGAIPPISATCNCTAAK